MLTSTDIPPGGEGKIEVTFDSSHKKGQEKKSVTVESNDPRNPRATLNISALIEVVFGFDEYGLDLGKIRKGQSVSKTTSLVIKDPSIIKTINFSSTSPYINANILNTPEAEKGRLNVEISAKSGMPPGRINETITARAGDTPALEATLPIRGGVIGNFEITPEYLQFHIDSSKGNSKSAKQIIKLVAAVDEAKFHLLEVRDADQRLTFRIDTLLKGKQYEISASPKSAVISSRQNVSGAVTITTDDKEQPIMSIPYGIYFSP